MSVYSEVESGTKLFRSRQNLSHRKIFDCDFSHCVPFLAKFVLPGDIWKCSANAIIRYQPLLAPVMTKANARFRYFYVPLRLVVDNFEQIVTGSKNGHLINGSLPECKGMFDDIRVGEKRVNKYSFADYLGVPVGDYSEFADNKCIPAQYWYKAYWRIWFDYYRDENLSPDDDFEVFFESVKNHVGVPGLFSANLRKDYFTSSLPWQLKGVTPTFSLSSNLSVVHDGTDHAVSVGWLNEYGQISALSVEDQAVGVGDKLMAVDGSFNMDDIRTMAAQTRIFERLARCGSRYTEYLKANFNISPSDGTLQRAQYLGGFKEPIVTTEVVQTGPNTDESDVKERGVGTLRGHGISAFSNSIAPFVAKEFGVIFGLMDITPDTQYTQGINREFTYKSRFDFFNPSFQHLSEQEVRNGEIFIANDGKNDETFGFQPYANELRRATDIVVGDMRDSLSYWTQAIHFSGRPYLNEAFIQGEHYLSSFHQPFAVTSGAKPIVCDVGNVLDVYRPMIKYSTPGLIDHN